MNPCKKWEPRVIDNELIKICVDEQLPKDEVGRLAKDEGIPIEEVEQINFEYRNILRIDHLWILTSLTKLCLNNNIIEKIENLNKLIHLQELDLSFNKISKIENLETLVNLKKLSLYENLITTMENMDCLMQLTIFSVGKNFIDDLNNVFYLRKFLKLTSLNMAGNPCAEIDNFHLYIATFLRQLVYYEYKIITEDQRKLGSEIFSQTLTKLLEDETAELEITQQREKDKLDIEMHSLSFVEYLNSNYLFKKIFENDEDGKALLEMGEDVDDYYNEYEDQFVDLCQQIFRVGQRHYAIRKNEIDQFLKTVEVAKQCNQEQSIGHMEVFCEKKNELFDKVKLLQDQVENDIVTMDFYNREVEELKVLFGESMHKNWKELMKLEIDLYEQMEDLNQTFEHAMNDLVNSFIEDVQGLFSQIRAIENTYMENLGDCASRYLTHMNLDENFVVPDALKMIMTDKETQNNVLAASHDLHMIVIDNREDILISRVKQWLLDLVTNLNKNEIIRNRVKVLEINHYLDIQKEEFADLTSEETIMTGN